MSRCIEELHFDVPLISTRRTSSAPHKLEDFNASLQAYSTDTSRSVPFLWETTPGVPKDNVVRNHEEEVYTPRPPPGRWQPPNLNKEAANDVEYHCASDASVFSDALEKISLSESIGIPCRLSFSKDAGPIVNRAPSFIMNRFLPAANALAASSAASLPKYPNRRPQSGLSDRTRTTLRHLTMADQARKIQAGYNHGHYAPDPSPSPSKACGIMLLFPRSMKPATVCGVKSPVLCQTPKVSSLEEFTLSQRSKKVASDHPSLSSDDGLSSKAWKSPGWGLPFLDTSRLRRKEKSAVERESTRRKERRGVAESDQRPMPRLKTPTEPWLASALNSVNRRRY